MTSDPLEELRRQIDRLDEQIVELLNARARLVVDVGRVKSASGTAVFSPDREQQILDRIRQLSAGPLSHASLLAIYRELMSASFALERPPRIAFLGPHGSFSHEAALGKFGASVEYEPMTGVDGVFDAVKRRYADFGVVPVDNSIIGTVADSLEALAESDLRVCCEIHRRIHHNLLARCAINDIRVVYSKPEAFAQCQRFLAETGMQAKTASVASTSRAAELARDEAGAAAIASRLAARLCGLNVLQSNIEDHAHNVTRFFVIGREIARPTGDDKTSLTFVTADRAGALVDVLLVFQRHGINMTMITSRPSRTQSMQYVFFVDVQGHAVDAALTAALADARPHCVKLSVLGSYPRSADVVGE
ncbi:MAG: prephenate dehydratase [Phycisphaerae bacterium]|nr:prephenate dehydratase [Phycisphaerae bacterium]